MIENQGKTRTTVTPVPVLPVVVQPDYAGPATDVPPPRTLVRVATGAALLPLVLGVLIFLAWIPSRSDSFQLLGLLNIGLGLFCTAVGTISLLWYLGLMPGNPVIRIRRVIAGSWIAILLLAINFPICWLILRGVDYIETAYPRHVYSPDRGD